MKWDLIKSFIDEIYNKPPMRNYPTNKIIYNHIDEIWSVDLAEMVDYKVSTNKGVIYVFAIIGKFSDYLWTIPPKNTQTITQEISKNLSTSKRSPDKLESDRGAEFYNSIFQKFLKSNHIQHHSRYTDKSPSIAERVIRTIRKLLKKPVFEEGNADWLSDLPSITKKNNNTIQNSTKKTPIQDFKN